jgi:hypothetical protein
MTYQSPLVSVADMYDELVATGRTRRAAGIELQRALADRAIMLVDCCDRPYDEGQLVSAAIKVIEAAMDWPKVSSSEIHHEGLHLRAYVRAARFQFEAVCGLSESPAPSPVHRKTGAGHPDEYDWDEGKQFVMQELERRGDPTRPENRTKDWRSKTDIARKLIDHLTRFGDDDAGPDLSTARGRVRGWLDEFQQLKSEQN